MNRQQLTLGQLIKALSKLPAGLKIAGYAGVCSYRGNYPDLALVDDVPAQHDYTVGGFLALLLRTVGTELKGYKGGMFKMTEDTPVYLASMTDSYGSPTLVDVQVVTSAVTDETLVRLVEGPSNE